MIGYGGGTSSPDQLAQLEAGGFGMMIGPATPKHFSLRYAIDNGAFPAWRKKQPWPEDKFLKLLDKVDAFPRRPDFGVCPDQVAQGFRSLDFSMEWIERLPEGYPWYLAVQDGMTVDRVSAVMKHFGGIFVGGTSNWKMQSAPGWSRLAKDLGKPLHIGRVNSLPKAFVVAKVLGADSFDGNNWNRTWFRNQTKEGLKIYRGRSVRSASDVAKPVDVLGESQMPLDLWGLKRPGRP